jgi:hypothetical protein
MNRFLAADTVITPISDLIASAVLSWLVVQRGEPLQQRSHDFRCALSIDRAAAARSATYCPISAGRYFAGHFDPQMFIRQTVFWLLRGESPARPWRAAAAAFFSISA